MRFHPLFSLYVALVTLATTFAFVGYWWQQTTSLQSRLQRKKIYLSDENGNGTRHVSFHGVSCLALSFPEREFLFGLDIEVLNFFDCSDQVIEEAISTPLLYGRVFGVIVSRGKISEATSHFLRKYERLALLHISESDLVGFKSVPLSIESLRDLRLAKSSLTGVKYGRMANLQSVELSGDSEWRGDGLLELLGTNGAAKLFLSDTSIGDETLRKMPAKSRTEVLDLSGTMVTNAGLSALETWDELATLIVENTRVTKDGIEEFRNRINRPIEIPFLRKR